MDQDQNEMLNENTENEITIETEFEHDHFEQLKLIYDFQYDSLIQTTNILEKGFAFYLFVLAGSLGYLFTNANSLDHKLISIFTDGIIVTTVFVLISVAVLIWGIFKGLQDLRKTIKLASGKYWESTNIQIYFKRGLNSTLTIGILAILTLIFFFFFALNLNVNQDLNNGETNDNIEEIMEPDKTVNDSI